MITLTEKEVIKKNPLDIKRDENKVIVKCSNCESELIAILPTKKANVNFSIVAECCFCGDKSYEKMIQGPFSFRPCANVSVSDNVLDTNRNVVIFKTVKVDNTYE